jgi:hypothetical protein
MDKYCPNTHPCSILGNAYSRIFRGTAFQCMVIGVLFLVPVCSRSFGTWDLLISTSVRYRSCRWTIRELQWPGRRPIHDRACYRPTHGSGGHWYHRGAIWQRPHSVLLRIKKASSSICVLRRFGVLLGRVLLSFLLFFISFISMYNALL